MASHKKNKSQPPKRNPIPPPPKKPVAQPGAKRNGGRMTQNDFLTMPDDISGDPEAEALAKERASLSIAKGPEKSGSIEAVEEQCFETLPVKLTDAEIHVIDERVKFLVGEIESKRAALKSVQSTLAGEIKTLEAQLSALAKKGRDKVEYRELECKRIKDYVRVEVRVIRLDTNEVVRSRSMTGEERNLELTAGGKTFKDLTSKPPVQETPDFDDEDEGDKAGES